MRKKEAILNADRVIVYTEDGQMIEWLMGKLKQAFLSKTLGYTVKFVHQIKKDKYYYVQYNSTKGFKYIEIDPRTEFSNE